MRYALVNNNRVEANLNIKKAICPLCNSEVIPKCGNINIWHFAHKHNINCDDWFGNETRWHREWKNKFDKELQEVIIQKENNKHIADIHFKTMTIELQNSLISSNEILERESFYNNMLWIINGESFSNNFNLRKRDKNYYTFRWKWSRKSWVNSTKLKLIDFDFNSDKIFVIKKIYFTKYCGGWGYFMSKKDLIYNFLNMQIEKGELN
jgi:competence CoiA-like predicted nuclease